jgi:hypothetical protein
MDWQVLAIVFLCGLLLGLICGVLLACPQYSRRM